VTPRTMPEDSPSRDHPMVIGLTGPIGCGKSTVARWLAGATGVVVDADALAREATAPGSPGHEAVLAQFGSAFARPDGTLDRAALGRHVFGDPGALAVLETIVLPLVRPRILAAIESARGVRPPVVVVEAIKLVEAGYGPLCDEVWLVTCGPDAQEARLVERGMALADARQRARVQAGMTNRLAGAATRILDTSGSPADTRRQVEQALAEAVDVGRRGDLQPIVDAPG